MQRFTLAALCFDLPSSVERRFCRRAPSQVLQWPKSPSLDRLSRCQYSVVAGNSSPHLLQVLVSTQNPCDQLGNYLLLEFLTSRPRLPKFFSSLLHFLVGKFQ